jgi:DNA-binding HxlR family transcriptional regulator
MMLTQVLKEMEGYDLVYREQLMEIPPGVEYSLTQEGKDLIPALVSLAKWGKMMKNK